MAARAGKVSTDSIGLFSQSFPPGKYPAFDAEASLLKYCDEKFLLHSKRT